MATVNFSSILLLASLVKPVRHGPRASLLPVGPPVALLGPLVDPLVRPLGPVVDPLVRPLGALASPGVLAALSAR